MSTETLLYLSRGDVEGLQIAMSEVIEVVEQALREKGEGRTEMPPKPGVHPGPDAFIPNPAMRCDQAASRASE